LKLRDYKRLQVAQKIQNTRVQYLIRRGLGWVGVKTNDHRKSCDTVSLNRQLSVWKKKQLPVHSVSPILQGRGENIQSSRNPVKICLKIFVGKGGWGEVIKF
jgi:hypothetical protein